MTFEIEEGLPIEPTDTWACGPKRNPLRLALETLRPGQSIRVPESDYTRKNIRDNIHTIRKISKKYDFVIRGIEGGWRVHCVSGESSHD